MVGGRWVARGEWWLVCGCIVRRWVVGGGGGGRGGLHQSCSFPTAPNRRQPPPRTASQDRIDTPLKTLCWDIATLSVRALPRHTHRPSWRNNSRLPSTRYPYTDQPSACWKATFPFIFHLSFILHTRSNFKSCDHVCAKLGWFCERAFSLSSFFLSGVFLGGSGASGRGF